MPFGRRIAVPLHHSAQSEATGKRRHLSIDPARPGQQKVPRAIGGQEAERSGSVAFQNSVVDHRLPTILQVKGE